MFSTNDRPTSRVISALVFATIGTSISWQRATSMISTGPPRRPSRNVQSSAGKSAIRKNSGKICEKLAAKKQAKLTAMVATAVIRFTGMSSALAAAGATRNRTMPRRSGKSTTAISGLAIVQAETSAPGTIQGTATGSRITVPIAANSIIAGA